MYFDRLRYLKILTGYKLVSSGTDCNPIKTDKECKRAATSLGLSTSPFHRRWTAEEPMDCFVKDDGSLNFNPLPEADRPNGITPCRDSQKCICRDI